MPLYRAAECELCFLNNISKITSSDKNNTNFETLLNRLKEFVNTQERPKWKNIRKYFKIVDIRNRASHYGENLGINEVLKTKITIRTMFFGSRRNESQI